MAQLHVMSPVQCRNQPNCSARRPSALIIALLAALLLGACGGSPQPPIVQSGPTTLSTQAIGAQSTFVTPAATSAPATATSAPAATTANASAAPKRGGTLRVAVSQEPDQLDPAKTILGVSNTVNELLYDRLVYLGRDGLPKPWLAESWTIDDGGKTLTFTLRRGLQFSDGTALDAQAVKFSFDRFLDPKLASPSKALFGPLQAVEATDPHTVVFHFEQPYAPFFTSLGLGYGGIVSPTAVQQQGDQFGRHPVGSGPFVFKEWKSGSEIILARNPTYQNLRTDGQNRGAPYLDQVVFTILPDPATQLAALESGTVDVQLYADAATVERLSQDRRYAVADWQTAPNVVFVEFAKKPLFADPNVRQAIGLAIDADALVKTAFRGYATRNASPLPLGMAGWDDRIAGFAYDPAKAKDLLAQAGWTQSADGMLQKDGQPVSLTLLTFSGVAGLKSGAEIVQANLKQIGIAVDIQLVDIATFIQKLKSGEADLSLSAYGYSDPSMLSQVYKTPGWNNQYGDPELDAVLTRVDTTLDPQARQAAIKEAQEMIVRKTLSVPLLTFWYEAVYNSKAHGFAWDALGSPTWAEMWIE